MIDLSLRICFNSLLVLHSEKGRKRHGPDVRDDRLLCASRTQLQNYRVSPSERSPGKSKTKPEAKPAQPYGGRGGGGGGGGGGGIWRGEHENKVTQTRSENACCSENEETRQITSSAGLSGFLYHCFCKQKEEKKGTVSL